MPAHYDERRTIRRAYAVFACLVGLSACDSGVNQGAVDPPAGAAGQAPGAAPVAAVMYYEEREPGVEPYTTRIIVSPRYLRLDDGNDDGDFVLLERGSGTLQSTNAVDGTILVIRGSGPAADPPIPLSVSVQNRELTDAPPIQGRTPGRYTIRVNDQDCYDVVAVPGLLDDAVAAMREYRRVLAGEHRRIIDRVPPDMHEPCDLAHNVFWPERQLEYGLPIQEWDTSGYSRILTGFEAAVPVRDAWFVLPEGYRPYVLDAQ